MKAYRYNAKNREDRKFNTTGQEKNPNRIDFYTTNLDYAENYRFVYFEDGEVNYECELVEITVSEGKFFDMTENFKTLEVYRTYIANEIGAQRRDYTRFLNEATSKKSIALWTKNLKDLENREEELTNTLVSNEFQSLSDYNYQNILINELKSLGFDGYTTTNEIAIF